MIQQIIVYLILAGVAGWSVYRFILSFRKPSGPCSGCGSACRKYS